MHNISKAGWHVLFGSAQRVAGIHYRARGFPSGCPGGAVWPLCPTEQRHPRPAWYLLSEGAQDVASTANLPTHRDRRRREERKEHVKVRDETGVQRWRGQRETNRKKLLSFCEPGSATLSGQLLVPGILHYNSIIIPDYMHLKQVSM